MISVRNFIFIHALLLKILHITLSVASQKVNWGYSSSCHFNKTNPYYCWKVCALHLPLNPSLKHVFSNPFGHAARVEKHTAAWKCGKAIAAQSLAWLEAHLSARFPLRHWEVAESGPAGRAFHKSPPASISLPLVAAEYHVDGLVLSAHLLMLFADKSQFYEMCRSQERPL